MRRTPSLAHGPWTACNLVWRVQIKASMSKPLTNSYHTSPCNIDMVVCRLSMRRRSSDDPVLYLFECIQMQQIALQVSCRCNHGTCNTNALNPRSLSTARNVEWPLIGRRHWCWATGNFLIKSWAQALERMHHRSAPNGPPTKASTGKLK
jgi:hypothetical protein